MEPRRHGWLDRLPRWLLRAGHAEPSIARKMQNRRSMLLDCIRGVAIISVVIYHVAKEYDLAELDAIAEVFWRYGLLGVDIFFPLSGFLISRFLLRVSDSSDIGVFFERRFFRIVPLYFTAVTLFLLASLVLGVESENASRIWITYLFLTGWFIFFEGGPAHVPYTITWSLSVEEFSYIAFGLCAWIGRRSFVALLVASSVFALGLRFYLNLHGYEGVYNFPPARLDSIAMGGLVAFAIDRRVRGLAWGLFAASIATYLLALCVPALWSTLKYTCITLATCTLIVVFDTRLGHVRSRMLSWLSSIGFYSYFTYLFHVFNIHLLLRLAKGTFAGGFAPFWPMVAVAVAVTHFQAVLSYRFFEGPLMAFGRRLEGARRARNEMGAPAVPPGT